MNGGSRNDVRILDGNETTIYPNPKTKVIMCVHMDKVSCRESFGVACDVEEVANHGDRPNP